MEYIYRDKFKLSEQEVNEESWDSMKVNLHIMALYAEKQHLDSKEQQ